MSFGWFGDGTLGEYVAVVMDMLTNDFCLFTVSVLSILKNPMILLGLVSMVIFLGMPKLVENSMFYFSLLLLFFFPCLPTLGNNC